MFGCSAHSCKLPDRRRIPGGIVGPIVVGFLGDPDTGVLNRVGNAMTVITALMVVPVLLIPWKLIPETRGADLAEMDAAVEAVPA